MTQINLGIKTIKNNKAWKIVEFDPSTDSYKTLFHANNGSRVLISGNGETPWIECVERMVHDNGLPYLSGWHVFLDKKAAVTYLKNFKNRRHLLRIVECRVRVVRPKPGTCGEVYLAKYIKFF